jgi:MFS transporter, DHA1 family, inner membrane transport protein
MAGNFAIGCGVMVVAGSLNDLSNALAVSPAAAGQLITAGGVAMGLGAPLLAALLGGLDRRRLLTFALLWYAVGHAVCALMPNLPALLPARVLTVLGAALFTPQAAAAINVLAPPTQRGRAITMVFMGWSISSVVGMPMNGFIAETQGWRWAFAMVAGISAVSAIAVWRTVPDGVRSPALSLKSWGGVLSNPLLMGMVAVTAISSAGQFTLFSYVAPYYRQILGASAAGVTFLFFWFGAFGLIGNVLMTRSINKLGAARGVNIAIMLMLSSLLLWPLSAWVGTTAGAGWLTLGAMAMISTPWALGLFASNSGQQARLSQSAPAVAPALLALNTSAIYVGQAAGAGGGGALLANFGFAPLSWVGLAWMVAALGLSTWAASKMKNSGKKNSLCLTPM